MPSSRYRLPAPSIPRLRKRSSSWAARTRHAATGKPPLEARRAVVHHLIDVAEPDDRYQAARFRRDAEDAIEAIRARGCLPVIVGGTGRST